MNIVDLSILNEVSPPTQKYLARWMEIFHRSPKNNGCPSEAIPRWSEKSLVSEQVKDVHCQIQQTIFGVLRESYVNVDMGAACVGLVDLQAGTSVSCKLNDDQDTSVIEYVDVV